MVDRTAFTQGQARFLAALTGADRLFLLLWLLVLGWRLLFLVTNQLGLSADEMHYWDWSRQPDLAYYSKGPMVAWLIAGSTALFGISPLAIRLPAVMLGALLILLLYRYARRRLGPRPALVVATVAQFLPIVGGLGVAMTTDPPMLLSWLVALTALEAAVRGQRRSAWLIYGVATALGVLTKATMLLLPMGLTAAAVSIPCCRSQLRQPGFWMGQGLALSGLLPLLVWNCLHDWVNWSHNVGHLGVGRSVSSLDMVLRRGLELLGGQWLLFGLVTTPLLLGAAALAWRRSWRQRDPYPLLLGSLALQLLLVCLLVASRRSVYPNWPLPLGLIALLLWVEAWPALRPQPCWRRLWLWGSALNLLVLLLAHLPFFGIRFGWSHRHLPTRKLVGWQELISTLQRDRLPWLTAAPLILSDRYTTASALAYGLQRPSGSVLTLGLGRGRMNQYDLWARDELPRRLGQNALIVLDPDTNPAPLRLLFTQLTPLPTLQIEVADQPWRQYQLWFGVAYNGHVLPSPSRR